MDDTTALYRHFDADGILLYVGIALSPIARLCEHRAGSAWYDRITTVKIVRYPTRDEAEAAELRAIREERPLHNIAGASAPMVPLNVAPRKSARSVRRLTARGVAVASRDGTYSDGDGLYLQVKGGGKSWIFRYQVRGRRREMGLGPASVVSLVAARARAKECREMIVNGVDPIAARQVA